MKPPIVFAPGFYGKLMTHADFVGRRVPPAVRRHWDDWLQECLSASRHTLADAWMDTYLHSPTWRFAIAEDILDAHRWAGLILPSVDQVGRQFPLTLMARLPPVVDLQYCLQEGQVWYQRLERLAHSSRSHEFQLEDFERALQAVPPMSGQAPATACEARSLQGQSLWWTESTNLAPPSELVFPGLPSPSNFCSMLSKKIVVPKKT